MSKLATPRQHDRGASLITALMLGALALTLALTLAGMGFSHLTVSNRLSNISQARALAEAVVSKAIERVVSSQGKAFGPDSSLHNLSITFPGAPGGTGRLTFDEAEAAAGEMPYSTYNMHSETSKAGYGGRVVPANAIHFVGIGSHNGATRRIEAIVHFPAYGYALSSKGHISSKGKLIVAGAEEPADVIPSVESNLADLLPGHIASNSGASEALDLIPSSVESFIRITGDAKAAGGIQADGARIDGASRPNAGDSDLPEIDLEQFDPIKFGHPQGLPSTMPADLHLDGLVRHSGDVTIQKLSFPNGGRGALLWVDGDLTIDQGLSGVGAIFATGSITIKGAGQTDSTLR